MILSFSVSNYRSIKDKLTLSMLPVKSYKELPNNVVSVSEKAKVLRSAVISGANASGKSNILNALLGLIEFIKDSSANKLGDKINIYDPFLLDKGSVAKPTELEIEFLLEDVRYILYFSYDFTSIKNESLFYYPKGQKVRIYERFNSNEFKYGTVLKGEKKSIENRLLDNQLYLSKAANEKLDILDDVYSYFNNFDSLFKTSTVFDFLSPGIILGPILKAKENDYFRKFERIILALDFGIHSLKIIDNKKSKKVIDKSPEKTKEIINLAHFIQELPDDTYELVVVHRVFNEKSKKEEIIEFPIERESSGTKNLFMLVFRLLDHFRNGTVMIIDEFEKSLHPLVVRKLVELFHDPELNTNNAQLIFSTHAINLLDNELFRRDQVWFTEKDEDGITDLFALSQIEGVRKDSPYDKWYLSGRFGATPIVSEPDL